MNRLQKNATLAAVFIVIGGGAAAWVGLDWKPADQRRTDDNEAKRLFKFGRGDVVAGRIRSRTATVSFTRVGPGFALKSPVIWPADNDAIDACLDRMATLRLDPVITEEATPQDLGRSGLDRPRAQIDVELRDGRQLTLFVGTHNPVVDKYTVTDGLKKKIGLTTSDSYWAFDRKLYDLREHHLLAMPDDQVVKIELSGPRPIVLQKSGDGWKLGEEPADAGTVRLFVVRLTKHLKADRYLTDALDDAKRAAFGLDHPLGTIAITDQAGRIQRITLASFQETGAPTPTVVAHLEGTQTVVSIDESFAQELSRDPISFQDRTLARFDRNLVTHLVVAIDGEPEIRVNRQADGRWLLDEPNARVAKPYKVDDVVLPYSALKAEGLQSAKATPAELRRWRLDPPARRVLMKDQQGQTLLDVAIGDYASETELYAQKAADPRVFRLRESLVKILPAKADDLVTD